MRSMTITLLIFTFCLFTSVASGMSLLPNINSQAITTINQSTLVQMTSTQNVTSADYSGQEGYYNMNMKTVFTIVDIIKGTILVAVPLTNLGCPSLIAWAIQALFAVGFIFDQLMFWRGIEW